MRAWRELWAVEALELRVQSDMELPQELRDSVVAELRERADRLREGLPGAEARPADAPAGAVVDGELRPPPVEGAPSRPAPPPPPPLPAPSHAAPAPAPVATPSVRAPTRAERRAERVTRMQRRRRDAGESPTVWKRLGPAFAENLGFGLAAFLIVAGAVYFTTTVWTTMSGSERLLVVVGGLVLLGAVLYGAARLLNRGNTLPEVERVLLLVVAFLMPVAAIAAGNLLWKGDAVGLGLLASACVLVPGFFVTRRLARVLDAPLEPFLPAAYVLLSALVLVGGPLGRSAPLLAAVGASVVLVALLEVYGRRVVPRLTAQATHALWTPLLLVFAVGVFGGRLAVAASGVYTTGEVFGALGAIVAAIGVGAVHVEAALFARRAFGLRRSVPLLVAAIALGIAGTIMAVGDGVALFAASAFGAYACIRAGLTLPVPWLAFPGLFLSALAYLKSPEPVKQAALALRDQAEQALGYGGAQGRLPLAWYGLTFLPYVAACGIAGWMLLRRDQKDRARVLLAWTFLLAIGLSALSLFTSGNPAFTDLRAPAIVLAAQGALMTALGVGMRNRLFVLIGVLGLYGGAACGLAHLELTPPLFVLVMSAFGIAGFGAVWWLHERDREQSLQARAGLLGATALLAVCLVVVAVVDGLRLLPAPWWYGFGYVALAVLMGLVGFAYRRPEAIGLASIAIAGAGARFVVGIAPDAGGDVHFLVLAALSALPLLAPRLDPLFPLALRHPEPAAPEPLGAWTPVGALVVQAVGLALLFARLPAEGWTLTLAGGLLLGSAVLALAATRERQPWPAYPAVLELAAAGVVAGNTLGSGPPYGTPAFAGVSAAFVLVCLPLWLRRPVALAGPLGPPLRHVLPLVNPMLFLWATGLVVAWLWGTREALVGLLLAGACIAVATSMRLALWRNPKSASLPVSVVPAGLLLVPAAAAVLTTTDPAPHAWPWALLGAVAATLVWAGPSRGLRALAFVPLLGALGSAVGLGLAGLGDPWWLLGALLVVASLAVVVARRLPTLGWTIALTALLLGVSIPLGAGILRLDLAFQPAVWLAFAAIVYATLRAPSLRVDRRAALLVAEPILAIAASFALVHAVRVTVWELRTTMPEGTGSLHSLRLSAAAFVLATLVRSFVVPLGPVARRVAVAAALALAAFVYAPVNVLLSGSDRFFWRPDVEVGVLALVLALALPLASKTRGALEDGRLGRALVFPLLFAVVAAVLTFAELRDPSTPLTALAVAATAFALLARDRGPYLAYAAGFVLLVTAVSIVVWWSPPPHTIEKGVILLFAATASVVATLLAGASRALAYREATWMQRAGREFYVVAISCAVLSFAFVATDILANLDRGAGGRQVVLAAIALGIPGLAALWGAWKENRLHLLHVALTAFLLFYAFLAIRTDALAFLDGYHLHALVVIGSLLLFASEFHKGDFGRVLAIDGLVLAAPAVAYHGPAAFGAWGEYGPASSALAMAALCAAAGARRLAWPVLGAVAAALLNLVLFAFWRRHGFVDPAFYGIPPGLTLLAASVMLRNKVSSLTRLALVVPGLALLYGSVAIQVVQADDPIHALVLFGLGLATVALGFRLRNNAMLVTGMVVIVLDVVVYLASHGFESGFFGAALLVAAGLAVMAVAALATFRRRKGTAERVPDDAP